MTKTAATHHSTGQAAATYFAYQQHAEDMRGTLVAEKYQPYIEATDTIVDFGCGAAGATLRIECGRRIGVEPNENGRALAEARGVEMYPTATDLPDAVADVVISNHALEHTLSPYSELVELRRALKPGGKLVMYTPLDDWRTYRDLHRRDPNHHLYTWAPVHLRNLLTEAGFHVEECRTVTKAWPPKHETIYRTVPRPMFDALLPIAAALLRRRQVLSVATAAPENVPTRA